MFFYESKDSQRLCSEQVINSISSVVKELIDNALDAEATSIEIKLKENGLDTIEVVDNGLGIPESSFEKLCARHYTSKLSNLRDLMTLSTLGFRGEALNSICNSAEKVQVLTKTESLEIGTKLHYNSSGVIIKKFAVPRPRGTTITVNQLFDPMPVRRKYAEKTINKQIKDLITLIQSYALARISVRFSVINSINGVSKQLLLILPAKTLTERVSNALKNIKKTVEITKSQILSEVADEFNIDINEEAVSQFVDQIDVTGLISHPGDGYANSDNQFFSINYRPVDLPLLSKILNQVYRSFDPLASNKVYPFLAINLTIPTEKIDLNVTPDKRTILINNEKIVCALVKSSVINIYGADSVFINRAKFANSSSQPAFIIESERNAKDNSTKSTNLNSSLRSRSFITDFLEPIPSTSSSKDHASSASSDDIDEVPSISRATTRITRLPSFSLSPNGDDGVVKVTLQTETETEGPKRASSLDSDDNSPSKKRPRKSTSPFMPPSTSTQVMKEVMTINERSNSNTRSISDPKQVKEVPPKSRQEKNMHKDDFSWRRKTLVKIDLVKARTLRPERQIRRMADELPDLDDLTEEQVINEVKRKLSQHDFKRMEIIGQFNRGFILCYLDEDLFVIDQHAADERCNFDHLLAHTSLEGQMLITPKQLDLNAYDEQVVLDNKELFHKNGFRFSIDETASYGSRINLLAVPSVKDLILCQKDIEEMIQTIVDAPFTPRMIRPTRVKELLASKACRKSIMINDPLKYNQMVALLKKLQVTEAPWTCAHGRPTVRILGPFDFDAVRQRGNFTLDKIHK